MITRYSKLAFILLIGIIAFSSCSQEEISAWDSNDAFAHFTSQNITNFSFATEPDEVTSAEVEMPITLMASKSDMDRTINIELASDARNPETKYTFSNQVIVKSGELSASLTVSVYRTNNLKIDTDTIVFKISNSDDFKQGLPDYTEKTLVVSAKFLMPSWWDKRTITELGACNETKLKVFYKVMGNFEDPRGTSSFWSTNEAKIAVFRLNEYSLAHYGMKYSLLQETDIEIL